jgi:hypothetical protein
MVINLFRGKKVDWCGHQLQTKPDLTGNDLTNYITENLYLKQSLWVSY